MHQVDETTALLLPTARWDSPRSSERTNTRTSSESSLALLLECFLLRVCVIKVFHRPQVFWVHLRTSGLAFLAQEKFALGTDDLEGFKRKMSLCSQAPLSAGPFTNSGQCSSKLCFSLRVVLLKELISPLPGFWVSRY